MGCGVVDAVGGIIQKVWDFTGGQITHLIFKWVFKALLPKTADKETGTTVNKRSTVGWFPVIYGKRKIGGFINFFGVSGDKNEFLWIQQVICEGEIESIDDILLNGIGYLDPRMTDFVTATLYAGTDTQTADPDLLATFPDYKDTDTLSGLAYVTLKLKYDPDKMPQIPEIVFIIRGKKCYDPRTDTVIYSTNPAICAYDYLTNTRYGAGNKILPENLITQTFIDAAGYFDALIDPFVGAVEQIKIQEANSIVDTQLQVFDNIKSFLAAFAMHLIPDSDQYQLIVEIDAAPVMDLTPDIIIDDSITVAIADSETRFNTIRLSFFNDRKEYLEDQVVLSDTDLIVEDNNTESTVEIQIDDDTDVYRMQNRANIVIKKSRQGIAVGLTCFEDAFFLLAGDIVTITHPSPGWDAKLFRVLHTQELLTGSVALALIEHEPTTFTADTPASAVPDQPDTYFPTPNDVQPVTDLAATSGDAVAVTNGAGSVNNRILVTWTPSADAFVDSYQIRYKQSADTLYSYASPAIGNDANQQYINSVADGVTYNIGVRAVNSRGAASAWVDITHTVSGKTGTIADLTTFGVTVQDDGTRQVDFSLTSPPPDFLGVHVRYDTDLMAVWADMTPLHTGVLKYSPWEFNLLVAGEYLFAAKAVDTSGRESTNALTADVTLPAPRAAGSTYIPSSGGAIHQSDLNTSTGEVSGTAVATPLEIMLPGGQYGFYPQVKTTSTLTAMLAGVYTSATYTTNISIAAGTSGYAQQLYINSSPPHSIGSVDFDLFIFLLFRGGKIIATYCAPDPPWLHNGPTRTRPDYYVDGIGYKEVKNLTDEQKALKFININEYIQEFSKATTIKVVVDQAIKNSDINLIKHPFKLSHLDDLAVLIHPDQSGAYLNLCDAHKIGESVSSLINGGYLDFVDYNLIDGYNVITKKAKWKN